MSSTFAPKELNLFHENHMRIGFSVLRKEGLLIIPVEFDTKPISENLGKAKITVEYLNISVFGETLKFKHWERMPFKPG